MLDTNPVKGDDNNKDPLQQGLRILARIIARKIINDVTDSSIDISPKVSGDIPSE
ncbi:MAG: hypothetical protein ACYC27_10320 [Armatimonadota bacterium]